jgi:hypothetical protein
MLSSLALGSSYDLGLPIQLSRLGDKLVIPVSHQQVRHQRELVRNPVGALVLNVCELLAKSFGNTLQEQLSFLLQQLL